MIVLVSSYSHSFNLASHWNCICDCGKQSVIRGSALTSNNTLSCGCGNHVSHSEQTFLNKLEELLDYKIIRQFHIHTERGFRFYDGFIEKSNTLIEIDSAYWHGNDSSKENDKFKELVAKQNGYKLVRYQCDNIQKVDEALKSIDIATLKQAMDERKL